MQQTLRDHQKRLEVLDRQAEQVEQESRKLKLVVYNVPDVAELKSARGPTVDLTPFEEHIRPHLSNDLDVSNTEWLCIGDFSESQSKPRPLLVAFKTNDEKHLFLKSAKALRQNGIRCDDYLTRMQQEERKQLTEDFQALKAKGRKPFFRGSCLKYHSADKIRSCTLGQAQKALAINAS